ncbi:MAG: hypothetical protein GX850_04960 [Clostridiaceae bacterium]|nr:hypothetical protein [Clostridiaceae bacterium]
MKHKPREASNRLLEIVLDLAAVKGHIGLFPHERFDADAIGAAVSLSRAFRSLGCRTTVLTDEQVPPSLLELPGLEDIVVHDSDRECPVFDFAIAVDCHEPHRLGRRGDCFLKTPLRGAIDHHVQQVEPSDLEYIDTGASSSCELVFEMIWDLELHHACPFFDHTIAILLLAGTITDTGRYSYSNTTPLCLRQAAFLLERFEVDLAELHYNLYERTTINRLQIKGDIFSTITSVAEGRILLAHVTQAMLMRRQAPDDDLSNLASEIRASEDIDVVFLFIETQDGSIRVSIRSKSCFDSAEFAAIFGGGGHVKAAGMAISDLSIEQAMETVAREAEAYLNRCSGRGKTG